MEIKSEDGKTVNYICAIPKLITLGPTLSLDDAKRIMYQSKDKIELMIEQLNLEMTGK